VGVAFDFSAVIDAFSEAVVDPSRWATALDVSARATGSVGALLFDMAGPLPGTPCSDSMLPSIEAYVRDGWIDRDERYRLRSLIEMRGVATDLDLLGFDDIASHPYYQEFLAPFGLRWFAGVKVAAGDLFWCLSLQRSITQGPFSPDELQQLAALSGQLAPAAALAGILGFQKAEAALEAFAASGTPAVMLDGNGNVLRANVPMEKLLGRDLQITRRHLTSFDRSATDMLDRSLEALLRSTGAAAAMPPVALPRLEGRPLLAHPLRLSAVSYNALAPCKAVVIIVDPDSIPHAPEATLRTCFSLTRAEARLASEISSGARLESAADHLGICYETARNQLKAIFAKTDTHRQAELVALLARLANTVRSAVD